MGRDGVFIWQGVRLAGTQRGGRAFMVSWMISSVTAESLCSVQSPCVFRPHAAAKILTQKVVTQAPCLHRQHSTSQTPQTCNSAASDRNQPLQRCFYLHRCDPANAGLLVASCQSPRTKGCTSVRLILFLITCRDMFYAILLPPEWGRMFSKVLFNVETTFKTLKKRLVCSRDCFRVNCVSL